MSSAVLPCQNSAGFESRIKDNKLVVFYFYASWDAASKIIAPYVEDLAKRNKNIKFFKVDVDEAEALADEKGVWQFPTFLFYKNQGQQPGRYVGSDRSTLARKVEELKAQPN